MSNVIVNWYFVQYIYIVQNKLVTDLFVKPTDTHQYLEASSCHVFPSKRSYSQALKLSRIRSETSFFDKRCNELEKWLMDRGYNDKLVRSQIPKARKFKRKDLLDTGCKNTCTRDPKLVLNVTYHPAFLLILRMFFETFISYLLQMQNTAKFSLMYP